MLRIGYLKYCSPFFGAMRIHSYTRMACLIAAEWLIQDKKYALSARKQFGTTVPQDENLPTCARRLGTTDVPHPGALKLISAPRSNQLGNQEGQLDTDITLGWWY